MRIENWELRRDYIKLIVLLTKVIIQDNFLNPFGIVCIFDGFRSSDLLEFILPRSFHRHNTKRIRFIPNGMRTQQCLATDGQFNLWSWQRCWKVRCEHFIGDVLGWMYNFWWMLLSSRMMFSYESGSMHFLCGWTFFVVLPIKHTQKKYYKRFWKIDTTEDFTRKLCGIQCDCKSTRYDFWFTTTRKCLGFSLFLGNSVQSIFLTNKNFIWQETINNENWSATKNTNFCYYTHWIYCQFVTCEQLKTFGILLHDGVVNVLVSMSLRWNFSNIPSVYHRLNRYCLETQFNHFHLLELFMNISPINSITRATFRKWVSLLFDTRESVELNEQALIGWLVACMFCNLNRVTIQFHLVYFSLYLIR